MEPTNTRPVPLQCVWESTLACNLRCRHCGSSAGVARPDELSTAEAADLFAQLSELGCRKLTISGGEPTLRPDFLEVVASAKAQGLRVSVITNAVRFDRELAGLAKTAGLESLGLSVDGLGAVHDQIRGRSGHFETLLAAMAVCREIGLPWAAITFVNNYNLELLPQMYDVLAEHGAFAWQIQLGTDMGNMRSNRDLLLEPRKLVRLDEILAKLVRCKPVRVDVSDSIGYYGPHEALLRSSAVRNRFRRTFGGCGAGLRVIGIESNGNIKGCLSIMAGYNEDGAKYVEGNIRERSLADVWNDARAFVFNRQFDINHLSGFCRQCRHAYICRGGCYGKRVGMGDPSDNPLCLYRVLCESAEPRTRMGQVAAAALLASTLGTGVAACHKASDEPEPTHENDDSVSMSDTETGTETGDPGTEDTASDSTDPSTDTDTGSETLFSTDETGLDYSVPWTDDPAGTESTVADTETDEPVPIMAARPLPKKP